MNIAAWLLVGAVLAGCLLSPLVGVSTINDSSLMIPSLLVSLVGAVAMLAIVNRFKGRRTT